MKKFIHYALLYFTLIGYHILSGFNLDQSVVLKGTIRMVGTEEPVPEAFISIDGQEVRSDDNGLFILDRAELDGPPEVVSAVKLGYELALWTFKNNKVSVLMRPATIKTISGVLQSVTGIPVADTDVTYNGRSHLETSTTDEYGQFTLKVPYNSKARIRDQFVVGKEVARVLHSDYDKEAAIFQIRLEDPRGSDTYTIRLVLEDGTPVPNTLASVNDKSYITDNTGIFR
ncbi:MAG: hypothetical protein MI673_08965, partial [Thiotrichales bacterium]|nr:hypothetical protein [Thiotrichales bacterium]